MERFDTYSYSVNTNDHAFLGQMASRPSPTASLPITSSSNELLAGLSSGLFEKMRPSLRSVYLSSEQYLYMQDDRLDYVYFPETAVVSEFRTLDDGRMVEINITGHEGAVGFLPLFCRSRVTNCTQVSQAGSAIRIEAEVLGKLLRLNPELSNALAPQVEQYVRQISQRSICNMYHSVKERLCTWLLMAQDRSGKQTMKLTHEQIARILGVYRPSVTCIALEMRKKKLITYSRGGLSICDREKVEQSACTCYMELAQVY
ncbi:MAG: cyclic nucleotide-binding protein [Acidobacteria bacterium OLB17]|nr:MAG: cyclic nucleotide-binding protein [Acidobacteria bacterium OLB17]MCZ2390046.1 Crp/Fnr family transcriptional regulator [Acidobacteriota bacterium]